MIPLNIAGVINCIIVTACALSLSEYTTDVYDVNLKCFFGIINFYGINLCDGTILIQSGNSLVYSTSLLYIIYNT